MSKGGCPLAKHGAAAPRPALMELDLSYASAGSDELPADGLPFHSSSDELADGLPFFGHSAASAASAALPAQAAFQPSPVP